MAEKALAEMLELVKCPVCWVSPRDAHQCPKCSKAFCYRCIKLSLQHNGKCPYCRSPSTVECLVRCPWLNDVCQMAEKAGESLRKCAVHQEKYMTHFDTMNRKPACEQCLTENSDKLKKQTIRSLEDAAADKEKEILEEINEIEQETKVYWNSQLKMKKRIETFSQNGHDICEELIRVLDQQTGVLQEHMNAVRNALNEIKVLIPKKLAAEVTDASKNKVFEFLTGEWSDDENDNDATFVLEIEDIRQLELETSPRHSKTMRVGDRDWYVDVGLLNQHRVGGWDAEEQEHLSVIIWQEESTRGTMSPPMSALIVAKDAENDLVEVVLFDKFNDLRGFGRRLFLSMEQLVQCGTTKLEIEVVLGRRSPSFSLRLLRKMTQIAKEADKRMRLMNAETKDLFQAANEQVMNVIRQVRGMDANAIASSLQLSIQDSIDDEDDPGPSFKKPKVPKKRSRSNLTKINFRLKEYPDRIPSSSEQESTDSSEEPIQKRTRSRRKCSTN